MRSSNEMWLSLPASPAATAAVCPGGGSAPPLSPPPANCFSMGPTVTLAEKHRTSTSTVSWACP